MELATRFNTVAAQVSVWTTQNPLATRLILAAVPVVVAVVTALATQQPCLSMALLEQAWRDIKRAKVVNFLDYLRAQTGGSHG